MKLHQYYISTKPIFDHPARKGAFHEHVSSGTLHVGHICWHGVSKINQTAFESQDGIILLGTLIHPLNSEALPLLASFGVTSSDNVASAMDKIQKKLGGFQLQV